MHIKLSHPVLCMLSMTCTILFHVLGARLCRLNYGQSNIDVP